MAVVPWHEEFALVPSVAKRRDLVAGQIDFVFTVLTARSVKRLYRSEWDGRRIEGGRAEGFSRPKGRFECVRCDGSA